MMVLALLAGLLLGVAGFLGMDHVATPLLVAKYGRREGSASMAAFFVFGPFGGVSGFLLGAGLVLWHGHASPRWGSLMLIGSGLVLVLGTSLLALTARQKSREKVFPQLLFFELELDEADLGPGPVQEVARQEAPIPDRPSRGRQEADPLERAADGGGLAAPVPGRTGEMRGGLRA